MAAHPAHARHSLWQFRRAGASLLQHSPTDGTNFLLLSVPLRDGCSGSVLPVPVLSLVLVRAPQVRPHYDL